MTCLARQMRRRGHLAGPRLTARGIKLIAAAKYMQPNLLDMYVNVCFASGKIFWRPRREDDFAKPSDQKAWNTKYAFRQAFTTENGNGYLMGRIFGRKYLAHRVVFACAYGFWPEHVDHLNGCRSDNRLVNLAASNPQLNMMNMKRPRHNTSGHIGVRYDAGTGKWRAKIQKSRKVIHLGLFDKKEDAIRARLEAHRVMGFSDEHGR